MITIKKYVKLGSLVFIKTVMLVLMVWIINISLVAMMVGWMNPAPLGYTVYFSEDGGKTTSEVYDTSDLEDPKIDEYKKDEKYIVLAKPGRLNDNISAAINIVTIVCGALLAIATYYTEFWNLGDIGANNLELRGVKYSKKAPLITALIGYSPFILSYLCLVAFKIFNIFPGFSRVFYYINYYAFYFISLIMPNLDLAKDGLLNVILSGVILIPVPLICYAAFIMGTKHIDIRRKIMYKKDENNG